MRIRHLPQIVILIVPIFSSCSTMVSYQEAKISLAESAVCCTSLAEFKYEQLPDKGSLSFELDDTSDSYLFSSGKSYFKAFHLPKRQTPYSIHITSFALGETIDKAHIFYPQLALLDDHFIVLGKSDQNAFRLSKAGYGETITSTWGLPIKLEGSFPVVTPDAKYLLVYTTDELLKSTSPYRVLRSSPVILPGLVGAIPLGESLVPIRHSQFGWMRIEVADVAGEKANGTDEAPDVRKTVTRQAGKHLY